LSLRERGIPAATWGGVRPQGLDPKQFADADFLYDNLVFLPVHQDLTSDSLQRIIEVVADTAGVRMTSESRPTCAVP
jgi:dTDP-4-amino-4,6-dideoxygalactose transaminase